VADGDELNAGHAEARIPLSRQAAGPKRAPRKIALDGRGGDW
jgi:hypothetical protein